MAVALKHPKPDPQPYKYEKEVYIKGIRYEKPPFTFKCLEWESEAQKILSANSWGYVHGSAGTGESAAKNRLAFQKWSIVASRMIDEGWPDLTTTVLGRKLPYPIAIAPVGVQKIFNDDGELATSSAAFAESVPYILSTASSKSIEDVAIANQDGVRWYQLYWPLKEDDEITLSLLKRAKANGYTALFVTLDAYMVGWRPEDMDNGYNPFLRADNVGVEIGFSDPVFQKRYKLKTGKNIEDDLGLAAAEWARTVVPGRARTWEDLKWLREQWEGPIVLKGILTPQDAKQAAAAGMDGVVVSNHGGREQDGGVASLEQLPKIVEALKGTGVDVLFDSGIRCGADIFKALALGAKMVLVGRPFVYGLSLGGKAGVEHILKALLGELDLTMHLSGVASTRQEHLNSACLVRE